MASAMVHCQQATSFFSAALCSIRRGVAGVIACTWTATGHKTQSVGTAGLSTIPGSEFDSLGPLTCAEVAPAHTARHQ